MATDEEAIRKDKQRIDEVNWRIRKIQEATRDTETAKLIEMGESCYSWRHPIVFDVAARAEFRYGDTEGLYWLDEYEKILKHAYELWQEGSERYEALCERVKKLGLRLDISLKGADLCLTQEFINSRETHRVDKTKQRFNFSDLAYKNFVDLLEYLEWKNEAYCIAEGQKRRAAFAKQVVLFEAWEQILEHLSRNKNIQSQPSSN